jgi:hypothetical protein
MDLFKQPSADSFPLMSLLSSLAVVLILSAYLLIILKAAWSRRQRRERRERPIDRIIEHLLHYSRTRRGNFTFVALNSAAVAFLVFCVFYLCASLALFTGLEASREANAAFTFSGLVIGLMFGLFTFLSWFNTLELLYYQQSQLDGYDQLLESINRDLSDLANSYRQMPEEEMAERIEREGMDSPIRILSPSPAIGNISARTFRFQRYQNFFLEQPFRDRLCPRLIMRADFSLWHLQFINTRVEALLRYAREGRRGLTLARRQLEKEFDLQWFKDIKACPTSIEQTRYWVIPRIEELLNEILHILDRGGSLSEEELQRLELLARGPLREFAHRTADVQVIRLVRSFKNRDNVTMLEGIGDAFPPSIAIVVGDRYYMTWMARRINGTSNDIRGYVSSERSALQIIEQLMEYYENIENLDAGEVGAVEIARIRRRSGSELVDDESQFTTSKPLSSLYEFYQGPSHKTEAAVAMHPLR